MDVAVVTGGSSGIGQAAAVEIAALGTGVVLTYRSGAERAHDTVRRIEDAGGSAVALRLDVADLADHERFAAELTGVLSATWGTAAIAALVNNAGIGGGAPFAAVTEADFDRFSAVLLKGPFFLTQRLLPVLADGGAVVNVGSTSALPTGTESGYSHYASQKGALHVLTRCWAKEFADRRIRVNAVAPGSTRTAIADNAFARMPEAAEAIAGQVALGRVGEPADIGRVIAFLAGPASGWITGQIIECSGGQRL
jgi:NAD(P)-dependent dehydrogenase (short-subunit alcohol dehydrogenase family)